VAYLGALKAGATVCVLDPQYPPDRQVILLDVARPRFLVSIQRANEEFGKPSETVMDYVTGHLNIKNSIHDLQLSDNGDLLTSDSEVDVSGREEMPQVVVGPDSVPTLSFTSGSTVSQTLAHACAHKLTNP
jgi:L-2-aminoadipate reductase